jgi:TRAP-type C4-dicarboxylate transport system permease small subunit
VDEKHRMMRFPLVTASYVLRARAGKEGDDMQRFLRAVSGFSKTLNAVGALLLTLMMVLTVVDVILRYLGRPITGTFELMSFAGALVVGLALAQTSLDGAHVNVDMFIDAASAGKKICLTVFNRVVGIGVFALLAWSLFDKGNDLYSTGEVSLTLQVPYYPVAYGLSLCCLVECLVLASGILDVCFGGKNE